MHAEHAEILRVGARKTTETHEGVRDGIVEQPRELGQQLRSFALHHTAPRIEHRPFGTEQHVDGLANLPGVAACSGIVRAHPDALGIVIFHLMVGVGGVLRHVDHDGPGPSGSGDVERLLHHLGNLLGAPHEEAVLHHGARDPHHVGFLEGIGANEVARYLRGNHNQGNGVDVGGCDSSDRIGGPRTRGHHHDPRASRGSGITVRHVGGGLLVTHQDVLDPLLFEDCVINVQRGATGIAEQIFHALVLQGADQHFSA